MLALVIVVHALLLALALRHQQTINGLRAFSAAPLQFLTPAVLVPTPKAVPPVKSSESQSEATPPKSAEKATGDFAVRLDTHTYSSSDALPLGLGVDWDREGATVANTQAASLFNELKHLCDEAAKRGEPPPPGCHKYRKPPPWDPEPSKFGLTDGPGLRLPFVRLGKRCVLGLGFFGCGVGKLPEANSHVLDDMRDPDRPHSSVPDPNE